MLSGKCGYNITLLVSPLENTSVMLIKEARRQTCWDKLDQARLEGNTDSCDVLQPKDGWDDNDGMGR